MKLPAFNRSVNYYNHLGVSMQASQQEIKAAYRTLAKQTHPDVVDVLREDNKTFEALHEAYQVLSDSSQKQQYDEMIPFFYGPMREGLGTEKLAAKLADQDFGYALKRVGIKEVDSKNWSLTYQRILL